MRGGPVVVDPDVVVGPDGVVGPDVVAGPDVVVVVDDLSSSEHFFSREIIIAAGIKTTKNPNKKKTAIQKY